MTILVIGGTGRVGSQLVETLAARAVPVRVLTRSSEKAEALPAGVEGSVGNLLEPATVRSVFEGVESAFLSTANSPTEAHEGLMAVSGAIDARVERLVFLSAQAAADASLVPHFGAKIAIEAALAKSNLPHAILRPPYFNQNDDLSKEAILGAGIYPQPLGSHGVARVDIRDVADAAANILTADGTITGSYVISSADVINGVDSADLWSAALKRPVAYCGDDLEQWEAAAARLMPAWFAYDLMLMYRHLQANGQPVTQEELERQEAILGHPPRRYAAYIAERAAQWSA